MIPLYKPFVPELPLLGDILASGKLSFGKFGIEFEKKLSIYFGTDYLITTNTFQNAIAIALTSLGLKPGNKAIVSPMACLVSTQPLLSMGLSILWADVDPKSGTLDPESVRTLIKENPKVIIHNHFCGYVGYIDEINQIGREFGIPVIDDGIEAFGSEYKGRKVGNVGSDITFFSFSSVRFPNTLDGGVVIYSDELLFKKSLLIRDSGIDRKIFRDVNGEINPECDISVSGYNAKPHEISNYIGCQQMNQVSNILSKQRDNAKSWSNVISKRKDIDQVVSINSLPNFWVYGLLVPDKRKYLLEFRDAKFFASGVHINNNIYSAFGNQKQLLGVNEFYSRFLALPCGWWVNSTDINTYLEL